jgi:hypothetical protein
MPSSLIVGLFVLKERMSEDNLDTPHSSSTYSFEKVLPKGDGLRQCDEESRMTELRSILKDAGKIFI